MKREVGVAGIIPRRRTVLALHRSSTDGFLPGMYDLSGGGLEPGESPEAGIRREVLEETGLNTSVVRTLGSRSYLLSPSSGRQDKVLVVFLLRITKGGFRVTLSKEHDEYRWVSDSELGEVFGPADLMRRIIHEYFNSGCRARRRVKGRSLGGSVAKGDEEERIACWYRL